MAAYRTTILDSFSDPQGYRLPFSVMPNGVSRLPAESTRLDHELLMAAQRCMDPMSLLNELLDRVRDLLPISGFAWHQDHEEVRTSEFPSAEEAVVASHSIDLRQDDVRLGRLWVSASRPIEADELAWLQHLAQAIAYPLRNTCLYQRALIEAQQDPLTCLKNRRAFDMELAREQARFVRYGIKSTLVIFDLNGFKAINDTWGHDIGDRLLSLFATGLQQMLRETDHAYRFGGDEFSAILPATNLYGAKIMANRLVDWLNNHPLELPSGEKVRIRTSYGMAETDSREQDQDWFRRADQALYQAKRCQKLIAV
jgi:diguanylate cyclase (GGDEF)-like protein